MNADQMKDQNRIQALSQNPVEKVWKAEPGWQLVDYNSKITAGKETFSLAMIPAPFKQIIIDALLTISRGGRG